MERRGLTTIVTTAPQFLLKCCHAYIQQILQQSAKIHSLALTSLLLLSRLWSFEMTSRWNNGKVRAFLRGKRFSSFHHIDLCSVWAGLLEHIEVFANQDFFHCMGGRLSRLYKHKFCSDTQICVSRRQCHTTLLHWRLQTECNFLIYFNIFPIFDVLVWLRLLRQIINSYGSLQQIFKYALSFAVFLRT